MFTVLHQLTTNCLSPTGRHRSQGEEVINRFIIFTETLQESYLSTWPFFSQMKEKPKTNNMRDFIV